MEFIFKSTHMPQCHIWPVIACHCLCPSDLVSMGGENDGKPTTKNEQLCVKVDIIWRYPHLVSIPAVYLALQLSVHLLQSDTFSELWIQEFHFTESSSHLLPVKETCVVNTGIVNTPVKVIFFLYMALKNSERLRRMDMTVWLLTSFWFLYLLKQIT